MKDEYPLYVHWYATLDWLLATAERFPKNARFSLASRIANLGLDVMEGVVECIYSKNRGFLLDRINLNLEKLRIFMRIAHDRRYISTRQYEHISGELDTAGRMTGGWKKSLETVRQSI